jgi:hypothetical protein
MPKKVTIKGPKTKITVRPTIYPVKKPMKKGIV